MDTTVLAILVIGIFLVIALPIALAIWAALILNRNIARARGEEDLESGTSW